MSDGSAPEPQPTVTVSAPLGHLTDGTRYYAPLGIVPYDPARDAVQCHLCGRWYRQLSGRHLWGAHAWTSDTYRAAFGLNRAASLARPGTTRRRSELLRYRVAHDPSWQDGMSTGQQAHQSGELAVRAKAANLGRPQRAQHAATSRAALATTDYAARGASRRHRADTATAAAMGHPTLTAYLHNRLEKNWSYARIARECGRPADWVAAAARRVGLTVKHAPSAPSAARRQLTATAIHRGYPDLPTYLHQRYITDHASLAALAADADVSVMAVRTALTDHGIRRTQVDQEEDGGPASPSKTLGRLQNP